MKFTSIIGTFIIGVALAANLANAETSIILQSTTSTKNSGLYDYILPMVEADTGIRVHVVAAGTGAAIKNAMNCDGDVLLVHSRPREDAFVSAGFATHRYDVMFNDFVIVGPKHDPANINGLTDTVQALLKIGQSKSLFASRGDESGTHLKELFLWSNTQIDPIKASGTWYRETGAGMGTTLNIAIGMAAYTLSDRATWIKFENKTDFVIHSQGDPRLFNPYGILAVNSEKCPNVNALAAQKFVNWMISRKGQNAISSYRVNGQQLFFPNAK